MITPASADTTEARSGAPAAAPPTAIWRSKIGTKIRTRTRTTKRKKTEDQDQDQDQDDGGGDFGGDNTDDA